MMNMIVKGLDWFSTFLSEITFGIVDKDQIFLILVFLLLMFIVGIILFFINCLLPRKAKIYVRKAYKKFENFLGD